LASVFHLSDGSSVTGAMMARCLLVASALRIAVSAVAQRITGLGRETIRKALAADRPTDLDTLERHLAAGLRPHIPRSFRNRSIPIAIDIHQRPFYGDHDGTPGVVGGKPKDGAKWFGSYATAVSLVPGQRHTLAVTAVRPKGTPDELVERLLAQLGWAGVRIRYVLLDRGFYSAAVMNALTRRKLRFILPMVRRGKAVERFFRRGTRGWFEHTLRCRKCRADSATCTVAVVPGHNGRRPQVFACSSGFERLPQVILHYQTRFGIETSYRQLGECLARTTSADPVYRLLLVGVSLLIRAWWITIGRVTVATLRWNLVLIFTPTPTGAEHHADAQTHTTHTQPIDR
jgi:putative transposase